MLLREYEDYHMTPNTSFLKAVTKTTLLDVYCVLELADAHSFGFLDSNVSGTFSCFFFVVLKTHKNTQQFLLKDVL